MRIFYWQPQMMKRHLVAEKMATILRTQKESPTSQSSMIKEKMPDEERTIFAQSHLKQAKERHILDGVELLD